MNYNKYLSKERVIMRMFESDKLSSAEAGKMLKGLLQEVEISKD